jgi:hypothetical protein
MIEDCMNIKPNQLKVGDKINCHEKGWLTVTDIKEYAHSVEVTVDTANGEKVIRYPKMGRTFMDTIQIVRLHEGDYSRSDAQYFHEDYSISGVPVKQYGGNQYYPYQVSNRIISNVNTLLNYVDKIQENQEHATDETREQMKKLVDSCTAAVQDAIAVLGTFK